MMKKYKSAFFSCLLFLTACTTPSTQDISTLTSTVVPTKTNTLTPPPTLTPTITPIDAFFIGPHRTFWTKSSVIYVPKASKYANGMEMILERFDLTNSLTSEVFLCFELPYGAYDWTIDTSSKLSINAYSAQMKTSELLVDTARGYVAGDLIPPSLTYNWDMRCFKTTFQFDPSAQLIKDLTMGREPVVRFELLIPSLQDSPSGRSFNGPWTFVVLLNT